MAKVSQVPNSAHLKWMPLWGTFLRPLPQLHINRERHQVLLIRIIVLLPSTVQSVESPRGIQFTFLWPSSIYPGQKAIIHRWIERTFIHRPGRRRRAVVPDNNNEIGIPGKVFQLVLALIRIFCPNYIHLAFSSSLSLRVNGPPRPPIPTTCLSN